MGRFQFHNLRVLALVGSLLFSACEDGELSSRALSEPIVAANADFKKGKLPSIKAEDAAEDAPKLLGLALEGRAFVGAAAVQITGYADVHASSVGFRLRGEGSGYWTTVVGAEDYAAPGNYAWSTTVAFSTELVPGPYDLIAVPFDEKGNAGVAVVYKLCVESDFPDNGNACDPTLEPPVALAVLRWNADVDLDLSVVSPKNVRYDRTNFSEVVNDEVVAELDGDRSSQCLLDGRRSEAFVWYTQPKTGSWYVYANLFDSCGESAVSYELTVYRRKKNGDGTYSMQEEKTFGGQFLRQQTQTSSAESLYLTRVKFP